MKTYWLTNYGGRYAAREVETGRIASAGARVLVQATVPSQGEMRAAFAPPSVAPVPAEVPAWRIKAIAALHGHAPAIAAALAALPEPARTVATLSWTEGNVIVRNSATTVALGAAIGLTPAEIDTLFREAAALNV